MNIFAVLKPLFLLLTDEKSIRLTVEIVLRVLAVFVALFALAWFVSCVVLGIQADFNEIDTAVSSVSHSSLIGFLLLGLFVLVWGYLAAGILAFRANSVAKCGDSHFIVLPILSIMFRLNGELMFITYFLLGIGGGLFVWLTGASLSHTLASLPVGTIAVGGIGVFLGGLGLASLGVLSAFVGIIVSYALAEVTVVLVEIAFNTRGLCSAAQK